MERCYIDGACCSGARFSFCEDCKRAKQENREEIAKAKTPVERSVAHIPKSQLPRQNHGFSRGNLHHFQ